MKTEVDRANPLSDKDVEEAVFPTEDFDEGYEVGDTPRAPILYMNAPAWREVPADRTTLRTVTVSNSVGTGVNEMTQVCGRAGNNQRRRVLITALNNVIVLTTNKDVPTPVSIVGSGGTSLEIVSTGIILDASDDGNRTYEHVSCEPLYAIVLDETATNLGALSVAEESYFENGNT